MVVPTLSALLPGAPGKVLRDERPAPRPVDPYALAHVGVLLCRPLLALLKARVWVIAGRIEVVAGRIEVVALQHDVSAAVVAGFEG